MYGSATIFDKDIWIYAISELKNKVENKTEFKRVVVFSVYDFFIRTKKKIGGKTYKELEKSLFRLSGTRIRAKITNSKKEQEIIELGLIDSWKSYLKFKGKIKKKL